ncbi:N-6 DNA methylase [Hymenobacter artigasi]|uniref:site-specific DNA-methyltransferase (adenine-specific) n=1 Tax=Hymenobacter artigasi TaxID=2719616 RepID=A0ABX1HGW2_9BACT|nr:class I SAM-dependent DNA methyltransferase [Hymenobacter artigasi]NKI89491.1 type I restriction enzyme M protein [Hymenobacter artigasi]
MSTLLFDRVPRPQVFEDNLWEAADRLRAKSNLKASEYAAPLLGLFFLRYATNRFEALKPAAQAAWEAQKDSRNSEELAETYVRLIGFVVPAAAHYDQTLLLLSGTDNAPEAVIAAMEAFEEANNAGVPEKSKIVLPKADYRKIPDDVLRDILAKVADLRVAEGDVFGKIYEYFLGKFALSEGQKGGEFYTPTSVVRLIVEIMEPHTGRILDPACGTGGMFVQSAKFVRSHEQAGQLSIYGQEQKAETTMLARLNLFVNGLKSDVRNINSSLAAGAYADPDYADTLGKFDFVMANPPFNVDGVSAADISQHPLFTTYGPTLAVKGKGKTAETYGNANYLWISLFATALNEKGRAGFVMANSASDARGAEAEARAKLVQAGMVDVMVTIASNFFYTVTLPVTLWFLDRAKTAAGHERHDQVLFIDARRVYNQVSRKLREFTQAQQQNLTAIVWLYRGETAKFAALRASYLTALATWRDTEVTDPDYVPVRAYRGLAAHRTAYAAALVALAGRVVDWREGVRLLLSTDAEAALAAHPSWADDLAALAGLTADTLPADKAGLMALSQRAEGLVNFADKTLRPAKDKSWSGANLRGALRLVGDERDGLLFVLERVGYFETQLAWLDGHFPDGTYRDVEGLCYRASRADVAAQQFSLNPGRYVGVALDDDGRSPEEFREFVAAQAAELARLHTEADALQGAIARDVAVLFMDVTREEVVA